MAISRKLRFGVALLCIALMLGRLLVGSPPGWASEVPRTPFSQLDTKFYQSLVIDQQYKAAGLVVLAPSDMQERPFKVDNEDVTGAEIIQDTSGRNTTPEDQEVNETSFEVANENGNVKDVTRLIASLAALALFVLMIVWMAKAPSYRY